MVPNNPNNNDNNNNGPPVRLGPAIVLALLLLSCMECVFVVEPGTVGLVVMLGQVTAYHNGLHYRVPFVSSLKVLSTKIQKIEEKNKIPTIEGLTVQLDTVILFRLDAKKAANLYQEVGMDYIAVILEPEAASAVRGLTSESQAKALYSSGRTKIQDSLKTELALKLGPRGIMIHDVLLKDIQLPLELSKSIELKMKAEQDAARMEFVLQKETQEAKRKAIEAGGIASFQKIVSAGISPELLQWKGVEATEQFAMSTNTKIIIMGNDGNSLPVILSAAEHNEEDHEHNHNDIDNTTDTTAGASDSTPTISSISATGNVHTVNSGSGDDGL